MELLLVDVCQTDGYRCEKLVEWLSNCASVQIPGREHNDRGIGWEHDLSYIGLKQHFLVIELNLLQSRGLRCIFSIYRLE